MRIIARSCKGRAEQYSLGAPEFVGELEAGLGGGVEEVGGVEEGDGVAALAGEALLVVDEEDVVAHGVGEVVAGAAEVFGDAAGGLAGGRDADGCEEVV